MKVLIKQIFTNFGLLLFSYNCVGSQLLDFIHIFDLQLSFLFFFFLVYLLKIRLVFL